MKKISLLFLIFLLLVSLCACSQSSVARGINDLLTAGNYIDWDDFSAEENTEVGSRYKNYFRTLSDDQKKAYNNILTEIMSAEGEFPEQIEVPYMESETLTHVYEALTYDNPEIMCFGTGASIITEGSHCYLKPDYSMTPEEFQLRRGYLSSKADEICGSFTLDDSEFDRELAIHDYIVKNCIYDLGHSDSGFAYTCIFSGYASCEGYAKAAKYLMERAGVECYCIVGDAKNSEGKIESHMWNIVSINGGFYHLDTTWDDPTDSGDTVSHIYFNLTEKEIRTDHGNFNSGFECTSMTENYFVKTDSVFYSADYYSRLDMEKLIINRLESGEYDVQLKFATKDAYDSAIYELITQSKAYNIQEDINSTRPWLNMADEISYSNYDRFYVIELMF